MVEIFEIDNRKVEISPNVLKVPELKALIEHYAEPIPPLSYVAYMTDPTVKNPYGNILEESRKDVLLKDFPGDYLPTDEVICRAMEKLELLNDTVLNKYYRQVRTLVSRLGNWAENVIIDDTREGNMAHVLRTIKEVGTVAKQFAEAEQLKLEEEGKRRSNKKVGLY
jgi:hypothetical protein